MQMSNRSPSKKSQLGIMRVPATGEKGLGGLWQTDVRVPVEPIRLAHNYVVRKHGAYNRFRFPSAYA